MINAPFDFQTLVCVLYELLGATTTLIAEGASTNDVSGSVNAAYLLAAMIYDRADKALFNAPPEVKALFNPEEANP